MEEEVEKKDKKKWFLDEFFSCNDDDINEVFINELRLPKDVSKLLKMYYIDGKKEKSIAHELGMEERTVRNRIAYARELCGMKVIFWMSNYFANLKKNS
jgi:DNA-directed RNA polymerase specialized sigma24 family protein